MIPQALILVFLSMPVPTAGKGIGSVTLLEGSLRLIRGTIVFQGSEGLPVRQGDILESSEGAFVQIEFSTGGIVALGPSSRLYILQYANGETSGERKVAVDLVLLDGWIKSESSGGKVLSRYQSPLLAATMASGTLILHSNQSGCDLFVESGSASLGEVSKSGSSRQVLTAKAGQFVSRRKETDIISLPRPSPEFIDSMPRAFRDTLPSRLARFAGKSSQPKAEHQITYDEIRYWLAIPVAWRRGFPERFAARLNDPDFRRQIEMHVNEYPEWEPILHPEKGSESPSSRN
jgi:hypothetical protein